MRKTSSLLLATAAMTMLAASAAAEAQPGQRGVPKPRRRADPLPEPTARTVLQAEIAAHNEEVERRKAEKRQAKLARKQGL